MQNPEDIIVLVSDLKCLKTVLNTSRPTALPAKDEKDPILVIIKTEEIKQFFIKRSTLRKNIVKICGLIWGQCSPALHSELEGYP